MNWEVFIPASEPGSLNTTLTVEARNWLEALTAGLDQLGQRGPSARDVMLDIKDQGVHVTDVRTHRVFEVRPLEGPKRSETPDPAPVAGAGTASKPARHSVPPPTAVMPQRKKKRPSVPAVAVAEPPRKAARDPGASAAPPPGKQGHSRKAPKGLAAKPPEVTAPPEAPANLPPAEVFFTHDEDPGGGNRLTYRERLVAVPPTTDEADAERLLRHLYAVLKHEVEAAPAGKFINLAVFDHAFRERSERPAVAALNWKDWRGAEPEVTFPLSAPAVVETSYIPAAEEPDEESGRRRIPSQELNIGRAAAVVDLNELLSQVFEAMQEVYSLGSVEDCLQFAVDLASDKIPCRAAAGFAMTPGKRAMVCTAMRGEGVEELAGRRVPLDGSLVGFAVRQGVAVAISDAENDPRVSAELDRLVGTKTRSVLCAPLVFEGRTFGLVELINRRDGDTWEQGEINILSYIADHLSEYIAQSLPSDDPDDFEADFRDSSLPAQRARPAPARSQPARPGPKPPAKKKRR